MTKQRTMSSSNEIDGHEPKPSTHSWQAEFLTMLPKITASASFFFRHLQGDSRDEMVQETVAIACSDYARLADQGRTGAATWSTLAEYAIRQARQGRQLGTKLNQRDVSSRYCQQKKRIGVCSLSQWDKQDEEWTEMVLEDRHATPADLAAFRIDFREFLKSLSRRNRRLAIQLAKGHAVTSIAHTFKISLGRVSQLRRELFDAWQQFHGEPARA